ncbi:asparaginase [Granulicella paludicola]|uniref:asparaginase n=1 Tax=Granulicella paludicola TaxID=474951 RepID=UPI0021DF860F|nr:asparaginase [Granulicella paludicola]
MRKIHVLSTGGTIEKDYSESEGAVVNRAEKIERYLKQLRLPECEIIVSPLLNKDSLLMTDSDRQVILESVEGLLAEQNPIIITHGTDTMVETGRYLQQRLQGLKVAVILTGAMSPLGFEGSDGLQNLTESVLATSLLNPGVHLVMHGEVLPIQAAKKDKAQSRFVRTD